MMKFIALFKKDLRECLPWMLLAGVVLLLFGSMILHYSSKGWWEHYRVWSGDKGSIINAYSLPQRVPLYDISPLLFCLPLALGLVLGVRQFWIPGFDKTWAFCLHRSVPRSAVLWSRFGAAVLSLVLGLGTIWTLLYVYATQPGVFPIPPIPDTLRAGWIFILLGLVAYCGTVLSGLSRVRWYTTRLFGIVFVVFILIACLVQTNLLHCFLFILLGLAILVSQIIYTFLNREF